MAILLPRPLLTLIAFAIGIFASQFAEAQFQFPQTPQPVVDQANLLSPSTQQVLENAFRQIKAKSGNTISLLTVPSLGGEEIEGAAIKVYDQWKLGSAEKDNGVLFLVAPKERKVRIEVGQGLEGVLPDVIAFRIIQEVVLPAFRSGSMENGIVMGAIEIIRHTDPDVDIAALMAQAERAPRPQARSRSVFDRYWIWIFLLIMFFNFFGGGRRRRRSSFLLGGLGGYGLGGGFGRGGGFGSGGGFGGGGGWGGGGRSSGGGASGGW